MVLKVPSSQFQALFEEILSSQPEPMNRQFPVRKSKSEALQLYAEKKIKKKEKMYCFQHVSCRLMKSVVHISFYKN